MLEIREVHKSFGATQALRGVSLTVPEGEIFGLLGPNGAGKTTLLSIVAGLLQADRGSVAIAGRPFTASDREVRRLIGIVPQELALYGELTARENLCFFGRLYGVMGDELERRVARILAALGLADRAQQRVATFSGGMQRRLNLGAGLVHEPRLLLLDEPSAGVDPQSRNLLFEEVRRLHREGMTVIYTSHYMEEVQALCPRIGIIDGGRLIACDTVENLLGLLPGRIVARLPESADGFQARAAQLPGIESVRVQAGMLEAASRDVAPAALRLLELAKEQGLDLHILDMERPNLERVFLHLTGRELRD
jgi:ABC-2 type transport system ATP-binding protein